MALSVVILVLLAIPVQVVDSSRLAVPQSSESSSSEEGQTTKLPDRGALTRIDFTSTVGVLLDDFPEENDVRDRAAAYYKNATIKGGFWQAKASHQTSLTAYRQIFRRHFFPGKKALTITPFDTWAFNFSLNGPQRTKVGKHDYVALDYSFHGVLVSDIESVAVSEPALAEIGGRWVGNWTLPVDPEGVFQRTRYACMDETFFPRGSVNSENSWFFFNEFCNVEAPAPKYDPFLKRCHWTELSERSCLQALDDEIGSILVNVTWKRIPYSEKIAAKWRVGNQSSEAPDLVGIPENLVEMATLAYRYFTPESCAMEESCIRKPGWRRLLRFTASQKNVGRRNLHLGNVSDPIYEQHNIFEYHACHDHYHFKHYSSYQYGYLPGQKTGFCLISSWRYNNNEDVPLHNHEYDTCLYQGIAAGWGDDYVTGLDCQWIDVTEMRPGRYPLSETINPDDFLCEGTTLSHPDNGTLRFIPTEFKSDKGETVSRVECDFAEGYAANNLASGNFTLLPLVSMVTTPCAHQQSGPTRDCGFTVVEHKITCQQGHKVQRTFHVASPAVPAVVRICEFSHALNISTACELIDALANRMINATTEVEFNCPAWRDAVELGGAYSILAAPLLSGDEISTQILLHGN